MNTCINCKKEFEVLWPDQWVYKRGSGFLCSWKCLREWDARKEGKMAAVLTDKQKENACRMAARGERPLKYIRECGIKNTTTGWDVCRAWARKNWPQEAWEKLPLRFGHETGEDVKEKPRKKKPAEQKVTAKAEEKEWTPAAEVYKQEEPEKLTLKPGGNYQVNVEEEKPNVRKTDTEPLEAASLWSRVLETGTYMKVKGIGMMLRGADFQLLLKREEWIRLSEEILQAVEQMNIRDGED